MSQSVTSVLRATKSATSTRIEETNCSYWLIDGRSETLGQTGKNAGAASSRIGRTKTTTKGTVDCLFAAPPYLNVTRVGNKRQSIGGNHCSVSGRGHVGLDGESISHRPQQHEQAVSSEWKRQRVRHAGSLHSHGDYITAIMQTTGPARFQ